MPLTRREIERRNFPVTLRGYESGAVDAHIRMLADEYEALSAAAQQAQAHADAAAAATPAAPAAVSDTASDQVRFILEATEKSVAEMKQRAAADAAALRDEAQGELDRARTEAGEQARIHVAGVAQVAHGILGRVEVMEREIATLLEGLRGGAARVSGELALLQSVVGDVRTNAIALEQAADGSLGQFTTAAAPVPSAQPVAEPAPGSMAPPMAAKAPRAPEPSMYATAAPASDPSIGAVPAGQPRDGQMVGA